MTLSSIYRTPQGETLIHALYDKQLLDTGIANASRSVATRFGATHVLLAGPQDGIPLVMLHGGNSINPTTLAWIKPLLAKYRLYAPDTLGHPGKSAPVRLSPRDDSYGQWVVDVLDGLGLKRVPFLAGSYGAGILLRTAAYAPERISKAIVMIPSGLVSLHWPTLLSMLFPMFLYRLTTDRAWMLKILQPMFLDDPIPEDMIEITEAVFQHTHIEPEMPRNVTREELARFAAPVLVLAAEHDRLFPAQKVVARAKQVFQNLVAAEIIPGSPHFVSERQFPALNARIDKFLTENR